MQNRMKKFTMMPQAVEKLLETSQVGRLSTIGGDGYPYTVAVHYWYDGQAVYFHGLPVGEKLENIDRNPKVCFETSRLIGIMDPKTNICTADAEYESVVIRGQAARVEEYADKKAILEKIVAKYFPQLETYEMPDNAINGTAVVKITVENKTGKYHN